MGCLHVHACAKRTIPRSRGSTIFPVSHGSYSTLQHILAFSAFSAASSVLPRHSHLEYRHKRTDRVFQSMAELCMYGMYESYSDAHGEIQHEQCSCVYYLLVTSKRKGRRKNLCSRRLIFMWVCGCVVFYRILMEFIASAGSVDEGDRAQQRG